MIVKRQEKKRICEQWADGLKIKGNEDGREEWGSQEIIT